MPLRNNSKPLWQDSSSWSILSLVMLCWILHFRVRGRSPLRVSLCTEFWWQSKITAWGSMSCKLAVFAGSRVSIGRVPSSRPCLLQWAEYQRGQSNQTSEVSVIQRCIYIKWPYVIFITTIKKIARVCADVGIMLQVLHPWLMSLSQTTSHMTVVIICGKPRDAKKHEIVGLPCCSIENAQWTNGWINA